MMVVPGAILAVRERRRPIARSYRRGAGSLPYVHLALVGHEFRLFWRLIYPDPLFSLMIAWLRAQRRRPEPA